MALESFNENKQQQLISEKVSPMKRNKNASIEYNNNSLFKNSSILDIENNHSYISSIMPIPQIKSQENN